MNRVHACALTLVSAIAAHTTRLVRRAFLNIRSPNPIENSVPTAHGKSVDSPRNVLTARSFNRAIKCWREALCRKFGDDTVARAAAAIGKNAEAKRPAPSPRRAKGPRSTGAAVTEAPRRE